MMKMIIKLLSVMPILFFLAGCSTPSKIRAQMGVQKFDQANVPTRSNADKDLRHLVEVGINTAKELGWRYDGSKSKDGVLVVEARWKGDPFVMTILFRRNIKGTLFYKETWEANGNVVADRGDKKLRKLYKHTFDRLLEE